MTSDSGMDMVDSANRRRPRRVARAGWMLAAAALVVAFVLLVRSGRGSNLEWYVSSPIDSHGRRVHILVPIGWLARLDSGSFRGEWESDDKPDGVRGLMLMAREAPPKTDRIREWLKKLRLIPPEERTGFVINLTIDRDVSNGWGDQLGQFAVDGKIRYHSATSNYSDINAAVRAIPIRGTDRQALVIYFVDKAGEERSEMANDICNSMYVE